MASLSLEVFPNPNPSLCPKPLYIVWQKTYLLTRNVIFSFRSTSNLQVIVLVITYTLVHKNIC